MKIFIKSVAFAGFASLSLSAVAEGTLIKESTINNASVNSQNLNLSVGEESLASTGSINVRYWAEIKNSTVLNSAGNVENQNQSIGERSAATTGSIAVE